MTLSEAIRAGAALRPQGFNDYFVKTQNTVSSCALGAAAEAAFGVPQISVAGRDLCAEFPVLTRPRKWFCPDCGAGFLLKTLIVHLNDWHEWSREEIAEFVEHLERFNKEEMR